MWINLPILIFAIIGNSFLGFFTYFTNPKSITHRFFFLFTVSIVSYIIINYLTLQKFSVAILAFWVRSTMTNALLINLFFFLLCYVFPRSKSTIRKSIVIPSFIGTIILLPITHTSLLFKTITIHNGSINPVPGPAMALFLLHTIIFIGGGFFLLIRKLKKSSGVEKAQVRLLLLGAITMFLLILISNMLLVLLFNFISFVGLLPLYTLFFVGFISYSIAKHRFLDISLLVARSVAYILLLLALGGFYTAAFLIVGYRILNIKFTPVEFIFFGFIMLVAVFSFSRVRKGLEYVTDKFLYKGYYDTEELLKNLSMIMSTTIELSALAQGTLERMLRIVRITRGTYVLLEKKNHNNIGFVFYKGYTSVPQFTSSEIELLLGPKKIILFEELEEGDTKNLLRIHQVSIVFPLVVHDEPVGILALGEKQSGDIYSDQDIRVLEIIGPQLAVAIQNAQEYEEIKRFNITLEDEVNKATKDLKEANEQLKQLDKMKDEFVSLASHELKTPMASIKSYLWFLLFGGEKVGALNEKQKTYADRAYNATERLIKLVTDMLNMSRLEGGRIKLSPTPVDMLELTTEVVTELAGNAQTRQVTIEVTPPAFAMPKVSADADRVKEVVINLIGNSLKFTPAGGKVTVSFTLDADMVKTAVTDTGKGITPEQMPLLFKKFGLIEGNYLTRASVIEGTGLGLYLSKSLIELHGGKMTVASEGLNKGATFAFTLPVSKTTDVSAQPTVSAEKPLFHPLIPATPVGA